MTDQEMLHGFDPQVGPNDDGEVFQIPERMPANGLEVRLPNDRSAAECAGENLDSTTRLESEHPTDSSEIPSVRAGRSSRDDDAASWREGPVTADPQHDDAAPTVSSSDQPAQRPQPAMRIVRITTREDIVRLIGLGREFHEESRYAHVAFSEAKFLRAYERMVTRPETTLGLYVERGDEIIGAMSAEIGDYFLGTGYPIATNHFVYVSGRLRGTAVGGRVAVKLMRSFMEWARAKGARELNMHVTSGIHPARTDKFLRRLGLEVYGGNYASSL